MANEYRLEKSALPDTVQDLKEHWDRLEVTKINHQAFLVSKLAQPAEGKPFDAVVTGSVDDVISRLKAELESAALRTVLDVNDAQVLRVIRASRSGC